MRANLILIGLLIGYVGCESPSNQSKSNRITIDTVRYPNKAIKEVGEIKNNERDGVWIGFYETGKVKDIKYFEKNKVIAIMDTEDFNLKTYTFNNIQMELPRSWSEETNSEGQVFISYKPQGNDSISPPSIFLLKDTTLPKMSLDDYYKMIRFGLPASDSLVVIKEDRVLIDNLPGYQMQYFVKFNKSRTCNLTTLLQDGHTFYVINDYADYRKWQYEKYMDLFKSLAKTFRLTNK